MRKSDKLKEVKELSDKLLEVTSKVEGDFSDNGLRGRFFSEQKSCNYHINVNGEQYHFIIIKKDKGSDYINGKK